MEVESDGIVFDSTALRIEAIRIDDEYAGTRVFLPAHCGTARLNLQIDMGVGDSVWPPARLCAYPTLLDFAPPRILAYPPEAVIAEKLEAVIVPSRVPQVLAFARRTGMSVGPDPGNEILIVLRPFLLPILSDLRRVVATPGTWLRGEPWEPQVEATP